MGLVTDGDRACGVVQHRLADGAQQQAGEPAPAAGADDGELGLLGGLNEGLARHPPVVGQP